MVTDEERREVAERLRGLAGGYVTIGEVEEALGVCISPPKVDLERDARNLNRLADLIEPEERKGIESDSFDRDALLAMADEMDQTTCDNRGEMSVSIGDVWCWAGRIREALGVVE